MQTRPSMKRRGTDETRFASPKHGELASSAFHPLRGAFAVSATRKAAFGSDVDIQNGSDWPAGSRPDGDGQEAPPEAAFRGLFMISEEAPSDLQGHVAPAAFGWCRATA